MKGAFFTKDRSFYGQLGKLASFIALQNVIVCMVGLVDNIMIGNYSQSAMTGIGLANQVQFLLQMFVGGVGDGMGVLTAQYWGTKNTEPIRRIISISVKVAVVCAVVFAGLALFLPQQVLSFYTSEAASIAEGSKYMRIMSVSYLFFAAGGVLVSAQRSVENVRVAMVGSLCALVVNVALNYLLIAGNFGFPELGVQGAAIATLVGRIVEFAVIYIFTTRIDKKLMLKARQLLFSFDKLLFKDFVKVALPVVASGVSWGLAMSIQTSILGHLDENGTAVAANTIANTLFQVLSVATYGLAGAASVVTGKAVGRGDKENLRAYVRTMQVLFLTIGVISSLLLYSVKDVILSVYKVEPEAYAMADSFLKVLCVTMIGTSYQMSCLTGIVRGGGDTKFVFYNDLIFMWCIVLPSSLAAAFWLKLDPVIVFFCLKSDQILKCAVAVFEVNSYRWVKKVTREKIEG